MLRLMTEARKSALRIKLNCTALPCSSDTICKVEIKLRTIESTVTLVDFKGLMRVRCFTQDDAHIFMTREQIKDEIKGVVKLIDEVYSTFGFEYHIELSTKPEDSKPGWECTCKMLCKNTDKSFNTSEYNTVNHNRSVLSTV